VGLGEASAAAVEREPFVVALLVSVIYHVFFMLCKSNVRNLQPETIK